MIRVATQTDLPQIMQLENEAFEPGLRWSETLWSVEITQPTSRVLVYQAQNGNLLGVITGHCIAEVADLNRVIVNAADRRKGIAGQLLTALIEWAAAVGAYRMLLEVSSANHAAIALYRSFGFSQLSVRKNYYGGGVDALVFGVAVDSKGETQ